MRSSRWSTVAEIKRALTSESTQGGAVLYHENYKNYVYSGEGHSMFLGITGSGKSRRGTIPLIKSCIEANESIIALDPKGEIYYHTASQAKDKGYNVLCVDFRHLFESFRWNPLALPYEYYMSGNRDQKQGAQEMIDQLASSIYPLKGSDLFWPTSNQDMLVGVIHLLMDLAPPEQVNMASVYQLIAQGAEGPFQESALEKFVNALGNQTQASMMLQSYMAAPNDTRESMRATFLKGVSMFAKSEGVVSILSGDDLHISQLDGEIPTAVYIILPDENSIFDNIAGVLCNQLIVHYEKIAMDRYDGRLPRRLNVCLEELGNVGRAIPSLPKIMTAGRSRNIRCHLVLQSLSQLDTIYGSADASTICNNADVWIAFRMNHWGTLQKLSNLCGEREVEVDQRVSCESLITPSQLASMRTGQALVLISGRTQFITWLPDFTQMYDCSNWRAPECEIGRRSDVPSVFDLKEYLKFQMQKKKMCSQGKRLRNHFFSLERNSEKEKRHLLNCFEDESLKEVMIKGHAFEDLLAQIDARILEMEEEEAREMAEKEAHAKKGEVDE